MQAHPTRTAVRLVLALCLTPLPLAGQVGLGGDQAFRYSIGVTPQLAIGDTAGAGLPSDRIPGGRFTLSAMLTPRIGLELGALRLAPHFEAFMGGVLGAQANLSTGRLRAGGFVDVAFGRYELSIDSGGTEVITPGGETVYRPLLRSESGMTFGGGGGPLLQYILGPGAALELRTGYYVFPGASALNGIQVALGMRWFLRDDPWYWRTTDVDRVPPNVVLVDPEPDSTGRIPARTSSVRVLIADQSGLEELRVDGVAHVTRSAPPNLVQSAGLSGVVRIAEIPVDSGARRIELALRDHAQNESFRVFEVEEIDQIGPTIVILEPQENQETRSATVTLSGRAADPAGVRAVYVNGQPVAFERDREAFDSTTIIFSGSAALRPGENLVAVEAVDGLGNRALSQRHVWRTDQGYIQAAAGAAPTGGPLILIEEPRELAMAAGRGIEAAPRPGRGGIQATVRTSLRVVGTAQDPRGVREVLINGQPASLQPLDPQSTAVRFAGYVPVDERTSEIEIRARSLDERVSYEVFPVQPRAAVASAQQQAGQFTGQRYAVIVGINDYVDPEIRDLRYAVADATGFYEFLRSPAAGGGGVPEANIRLLLNEQATQREVMSALYTFLDAATEDDIVYIFIAAHGAPDRRDQLYLLPHDAVATDLPATAVPMHDVNIAMRRIEARHAIVFTDACHSAGVGAGPELYRGGDAYQNQINQAFLQGLQYTSGGLAVFTASEAGELSAEGDQWGGHGVFTYHLLQGLRGAADNDADGLVRLGELYEFVRDGVIDATDDRQHPDTGPHTYDRYMPIAITPRVGGR